MSLYSDLTNLMFDSVTVHRFVSGSGGGQGQETYNSTTETLSPVRITRNVETLYDAAGRAVLSRGKIIMPVPAAGPLNEKDKLVSGDGEVFRVFRVIRKKDKQANEYHVVYVV